jgi:hypothetical protein
VSGQCTNHCQVTGCQDADASSATGGNQYVSVAGPADLVNRTVLYLGMLPQGAIANWIAPAFLEAPACRIRLTYHGF